MNEMPTVGQRVRALHFHTEVPPNAHQDEQGLVRTASGVVVTVNDNVTVPPGTLGTVDRVAPEVNQIGVAWDNGRTLHLMIDTDVWELA